MGIFAIPETNSEGKPLKMDGLEDEFPFGKAYFQGRLVLGRVLPINW